MYLILISVISYIIEVFHALIIHPIMVYPINIKNQLLEVYKMGINHINNENKTVN